MISFVKSWWIISLFPKDQFGNNMFRIQRKELGKNGQEQNSPKCPTVEQTVPFTDRNLKQKSPK